MERKRRCRSKYTGKDKRRVLEGSLVWVNGRAIWEGKGGDRGIKGKTRWGLLAWRLMGG